MQPSYSPTRVTIDPSSGRPRFDDGGDVVLRALSFSPSSSRRLFNAPPKIQTSSSCSGLRLLLQGVVHAVLAGIVVAIVLCPVMTGFATMIFSHPEFSSYLPLLTKLVFASSMVHQIVITSLSPLPFAIGQVQDTGMIFLASMASSIVTELGPSVPLEERIATVLVHLSISTMFVGVGLILTGKARLASLVQYLPTPVIGGYLAYVGFFMVKGGVSLTTGVSLASVQGWAELVKSSHTLMLLAPGLIGGILLAALTSRFRHFAVFPTCILVLPASFFLVVWISGYSLDDARAAGFLEDDGAGVPVLDVYALFEFGHIHWGVMPAQIPTLLSMFVVIAFASSLDIASICMGTTSNLNYNTQLKTVGISNLVSGLLGGYTGSYIFSQTLFASRFRPSAAAESRFPGITRLVGATLAVCEFGIVVTPISLMVVVPKFLFGAVMIFIGIDLLKTWLVGVFHKLLFAEYLTVVGTFCCLNVFGVQLGLATGIALAATSFLVEYAKTQDVRIVHKTSNVIRNADQHALLYGANFVSGDDDCGAGARQQEAIVSIELQDRDAVATLSPTILSLNLSLSQPILLFKPYPPNSSPYPLHLSRWSSGFCLKIMSRTPLHLVFLLCFLILCVQSHSSRFASISSSSSDLVSDGVNDLQEPSYLRLNTLSSNSAPEESCEQSYGFLPCTTSVLGNMFLIIVYGYLMFLAAKYLSAGSELLLEILGPGIVGGLFLPALGALPDAMLILVSGLAGSAEVAQSQVSVGMGLLAGSTVMLLTLIWGTCVIVGKCDLEGSVAIDSQDTKGFSLTESGVSTDIWTSYAARIMVISVFPFLIVQLPQMLNSTSGRHLAVLIALIISISMFIIYCLYQVFQPWIQRRKLAFVKHKHVIFGLLRHLKQQALGRLLTENGEPDKEIIDKLFSRIDENKDGRLSASELRALIVGIQFEELDLDHEDAVEKILNDFDTSRDSHVDATEFGNGIIKWLSQVQGSRTGRADDGPHTMKFLHNFHQETKREHDLLDVGEQSDEVVEDVEGGKGVLIKAILFLLLGTAIAAAFADPLVDVVHNFSNATNIPAFFISFIALPLATNSSEAVSAIIFASRDKRKTASLTFSELYGAVTMNNVLCLSVFLALVYMRGLVWNFSSEVLVILVVTVIMGLLGSFRTAFPLWTALVALLLYPLSLVLVYVLDYVFGWS